MVYGRYRHRRAGRARKWTVQRRLARYRKRRYASRRSPAIRRIRRQKRFMRRSGWSWRNRGGKKVVPMTYTYVGNFSSGGTNQKTAMYGPFRIDDPYDPNPNLTGAWNVSSSGYDFYKAYYRFYRVVSARVSCRYYLINSGSGGMIPLVGGYSIGNEVGTTGGIVVPTWMSLASRGGCVFLGTVGENFKKCRSRYWSRNAVENREYRDLHTAMGSSPSSTTPLWCWVSTSDQNVFESNLCWVKCILKIKQYVELSGSVGPEIGGRAQISATGSGTIVGETGQQSPVDPTIFE